MKNDYARFLARLTEYSLQENVDIRAYCLMSNHFHLLVHCESIDRLSRLMQRLLTSYSVYFNRRTGRSGHLFQSRFQSRPVETDSYYEQLVLYISRNPAELAPPGRYPWLGGPALSGPGPGRGRLALS